MKLRIISGAIGTVIVFVVLLLMPSIVVNVASSLLCALAVYELLAATHRVHHRGVILLSMAFAATTPFFSLMSGWAAMAGVVFAYFALLLCLQVIGHKTLKAEETGFAFFVSLMFPLAISCIAYLRGFSERDGVFYVLLALVLAWMSDIGAYFTGTFFGKHKMCPQISPKKTWEGFLGGVIVAVLSALLTALIYQHAALGAAQVSYVRVLLLAVVCAPLSVLGDLVASVIKRQSGIKDFGNLMPGHGGVMDRFDSLILVAPLTYVWLYWLPLISG